MNEVRTQSLWTGGVVIAIAAIIASLVVSHVATTGIAALTGDARWHVWRLDLEFENNIPTFFSTLLLLTASLLAGVTAYLTRMIRGAHIRSWSALAAILFVMATDEALSFHELLIPLNDRFGLRGPFEFAWVVPAIPVVIVAAAAFVPFLAHLEARTRRLIVVAGVCYVGGALGLEMVEGWYLFDVNAGERSFAYSLLVGVEELLEMSGIALLIHALLTNLASRFPRLRLAVETPRDARAPWPVAGPGAPLPRLGLDGVPVTWPARSVTTIDRRVRKG